jgi:hypothetical protein
MERRGFFSTLLAGLAAWCGWKVAAAAPIKPKPPIFVGITIDPEWLKEPEWAKAERILAYWNIDRERYEIVNVSFTKEQTRTV